METPPVISVTNILYTADATSIHRLFSPLQIREITVHAMKYQDFILCRYHL